jgi:CRP/FNR family cyclic AMP-dependent transcriptional regulator
MSVPSVLDRKPFPAGHTIFAEGQPGRHAYLVQSGSVDIVKDGTDGPLVLGRIGAGGLFGEMALIDDAPRMASAIARENTVCIVISKAVMEKKLAAADPFVVGLLRILLGNLRSLARA